MSGAQGSTFGDPNILLRTLSGDQTAQVQRNQLLNQGAQQALNENEIEQISRAANWVISQDPENKDPSKQASAYSTAVRLLNANGFAKNAPGAYPGFDAMQGYARLGTPSAEQFKVGENRAALAALAPGATPPSTAPATDGGGGTSDNNFGNIRPTGASSGFNTYATPQEGVAAMSSNLAAYASKHGINTLNGLTARWAPKGDGNNDPTAYAASLGKMLGLDPNAEINLADPLLQSRLIPAMAQIEKGRPFSQPRDVLLAGIQAGLGDAPITAAAAPPGAVPPRPTQFAGPGAPPQPAATAAPAGPPDLMGPRPLPPIGPGSPVVTPQSLANTPAPTLAPQNALAPPPPPAAPAVAAPAAPPPAAPAPPAAAQPPQVALPPRPPIGQDGLQDAQRRELAVLRATGRISPADYIAKQEQMVSHNDALLQQWQTDVRQAQNDALTRQDKATTQAREAEQLRLSQVTSQREQEAAGRDAERLRLAQEADKRAAAEAKRAGLPAGYRLDDSGKAVRIDGLPPDTAVLEAQANAGRQAQRQFDQENTLRDEFQKLTGDFRIVQTSYENIRSAAKANDGAGDMSLLYNYVRLLDPTSVVRESEFAAAAASGSFGQRVQGAMERVLSGARMPETLRQSFIREGGNLYNNQLRSHNTVADQYEELARANGLEPKRVVTRFARPQEDTRPPLSTFEKP